MEELKSLMKSRHGQHLLVYYANRLAEMTQRLVDEEAGLPTEALKIAIRERTAEFEELKQLVNEYDAGSTYGDNE